MTPVETSLREKMAMAIGLAFGAEYVAEPLLAVADRKFADYQSSVALALSKKVSLPPREVATRIVQHLDVAEMCETPAIAGPGFINLRLRTQWSARMLAAHFDGEGGKIRAGVDRTSQPRTVVVDYGGANIAKQMHAGHLRSTVIGDALARTMEFVGHRVVRQNHVGDFGTQFGMLIRHGRDMKTVGQGGQRHIDDLDAYYREASKRDKEDPQFSKEARQAVVALQNGDADAVETWQWISQESVRHQNEIFKLLDVTLTDADLRGESFYKDQLRPLVERLRASLEPGGEGAYTTLNDRHSVPKKVKSDFGNLPPADAAEAAGAMEGRYAVERVRDSLGAATVTKPFAAVSDGAVCVFLPGFKDKDDNALPLIIQKTDGAFLYATTDLAAIDFRAREEKTTPREQAPLRENWHADRIIYVSDARQTQHFAMVFAAAVAAGLNHNPATGQAVALEHAAFGMMLGEDGRPFKTRSGETVPLLALLGEALERANTVILEKSPEMPEERRKAVSRAVGIAALKFGDLRQDRSTDYVFSWDRMLSLDGNTGPYLQYAYARIGGILRKAAADGGAEAGGGIILAEGPEIALGAGLLRFPAVVESVARDLKPHYLCQYLYDLTRDFSIFYEQCPVLKAPDPATRASRLALCRCVGNVLRTGLRDMLGVRVLDEM